jgi:glutamine cyclotransferase
VNAFRFFISAAVLGLLAAAPAFAQEATPEATAEAAQAPQSPQVLSVEAIVALLPANAPAPIAPLPEPPVLVPEIVARYPHDPQAFTQGLEWWGDRLLESTGQYGESQLREVALETGTPVRAVALPAEVFAEGLTRVDDRLIQLTWREGVALVWDAETFTLENVLAYRNEGWGLCYDGEHLWHSDGTAMLTRRDPATFAQTGFLTVSRAGLPVMRINELECVGGRIVANVWYSTDILVISSETGEAVAVIDGSGLLSEEERAALGPDAVLNGIAYREASDTWFLTGKLWPTLFEVRLTLP